MCGQSGVILPIRDCPFCSRNNISPKSTQEHESFLSQNIFHENKKIFCDFPVRTELENEKKDKMHHYFCIRLASWLPFQCSKINKYEDFFQCSLSHTINPFLTKLVWSRCLDIAGYGSIKNLMQKRELGQNPAILT